MSKIYQEGKMAFIEIFGKIADSTAALMLVMPAMDGTVPIIMISNEWEIK
jgi:hypothetical protein